jgi:uncharacterized protein
MSAKSSHPNTAGVPASVEQEWSKWLSLDKDPEVPFIHRFETKGNKYIFDVNTMHIVRVEQAVWAIILDFGRLSKSAIVSRYSPDYGVAAVASAYDGISRSQQQDGLFLCKRPEIKFPFTGELIEQKLATQRMILILNVTEKCNFRCSYCVYGGTYTGRRTHSSRQMNWRVAKKAIDELLLHRDNGQPAAISFYGGEPLLNLPLIQKCVGYVRGAEGGTWAIFTLTTNGSLLSGEAADFLASEDFVVNVSVDGPQQIHDRCRRGRDGSPTWEPVLSNLRTFLKKYPRYRTNGHLNICVVMSPPLDAAELDRFFCCHDLFSREMSIVASGIDPNRRREADGVEVDGLDVIYSNFLDNLIAGGPDSSTSPITSLQKALHESEWLMLHKRFENGRATREAQKGLPDEYCVLATCIPGVRRTFVSIDGDYWPCERVPETAYLKIGTVDKGLDAAKVTRLLADWVYLCSDQCKFCWCLPICQVGCWATVRHEKRPTPRDKLMACAAHRKQKHKTLVDYCTVLEKNAQALDYMKNITVI